VLHTVPQLPGPQLYCGPTSICAVTGLCQLDVLDAVRHYRGHPNNARVVSMCDHEVVGILGYLGWATRTWEPFFGHSRLDRYVAALEPTDNLEIISLRTHYTAISYTEMVDTATFGEVVPLWNSPRMGHHVQHAIEVRKLRPRPQRTR
jgi:hypothetical protein